MQIKQYKIISFDKIDSTQLEAKRRIINSNTEFIILADIQTQAFGRSGAPWISKFAGNLYMSMAIKRVVNIKKIPQLSLIVGYAMYEAINFYNKDAQADLKIKWPNDIICNNKKLGGILVQNIMANSFSEEKNIIIGCGINIKEAPKLADQETISFQDANIKASRMNILNKFIEIFDIHFLVWNEYGFKKFNKKITNLLFLKNKYIKIESENNKINLTPISVDEDASLVAICSKGQKYKVSI